MIGIVRRKLKKILTIWIGCAVMAFLAGPFFFSGFSFAGIILQEGRGKISRLSNKLKRHALVIGINNYGKFKLQSAIRDSTAMTQLLSGLGFMVVHLKNPSRTELIAGTRNFGNDLKKSKGVGVFYFAGYGYMTRGKMFLVPVRVNIAERFKTKNIERLNKDSVALDFVTNTISKAKNPGNFIFLDSDYQYWGAKNNKTLLPPQPAPPNILISYSAQPGGIGSENSEHGEFTGHLLKLLGNQKAEIKHTLNQVRKRVHDSTKGAQLPWFSSGLDKEFYFAQKPKKGIGKTPGGSFR
ncbi:MAG: caspase family protein [Nitrospinae bacterium]|nr:caspase family protein [Nitrospinota bacterium]